MKPYAHAMSLVALSFVSACDSSGITGRSNVRVSIALTGDECGVVSGNATVTAPDMVSIGPVPLAVSGAALKGVINEVPAGTARTVTVAARDARNLVVYEGSTQVDVVAGLTVAASIVLTRNLTNCPIVSTGSIEVTGTIETVPPPPPPPEDGVLRGPAFAFPFVDATLTTDGVLHFFDAQADRIHRLDLNTRALLPDLQGSLDAVSMAVAPDGSVAYLGYAGGRIDVFDLTAGTSAFFAAAPASVSTMIVVGPYLFTIDGSGAWDTQSLLDRATGARVYAVDWRDTSRSIAYSPLQGRVYFLDSGVSPTDVNMVPIDLATGKLGAETDSPYHGDYSLPNPLRLLPDESGVVVGSGIIFNATDLTYRTSIGLTFEDIAFLGDRMYLVDTVGGQTQLRELSSTFDILSAQYFPGQARRIFAYEGGLVLVTQAATSLEVRFIDPCALSLSSCDGGLPGGPGPDAPGGPAYGAPVVDQDTALAYNGYASGYDDCWQSFTAGRTGSLAAVRVWAFLPSNVTLTFYEGEGTSGAMLATTTSLVDLGDARWEAALLDVNVTAGMKYTVRLGAPLDLNWIVGTYDYAGGTNNVYGTGADFGITTYVGEPTAP